jgi:SAM-dependent methyltransferase
MFGPGYDFGYSALLTRSHLVIFVVFAVLAILARRLGSKRWITGTLTLLALYGLAGTIVVHQVLGFNQPGRLPTPSFLAAGTGRVLDLGAGSGRATLMVALERPAARVTALDLYKGYFGIEDNTPARLMANARAAGVADRVDVTVGDMRDLPFETGTFDAALSAFAIDHLPRKDIPAALTEAARVLKPNGQFLYLGLNSDAYVRFVFPPLHGHGWWHRSEMPDVWRGLLTGAGFDVVGLGTQPGTLWLLGQKKSSAN